MIRLDLLGSVDLTGPDGTEIRAILAQPKPLAVLAYLAAATPAGYHRREELLSVFWPEMDSTRGRRALSQALHVLRNDLEEGAITSRGVEEVGLDRGIVSSDVDEFRSAIAEQDWDRASTLYRGELLSGFQVAGSPEFDQWLDKERAQLRELGISAAWHLSENLEASNDPGAAYKWARRATELDPYSEEAFRKLLSLLDRSGNRAEAARAYEEFRSRLSRDLDLEPSELTRQLASSLREAPVGAGPKKETRNYEAPASAPEMPMSSSPVNQRSNSWKYLIGVSMIVAIAAVLINSGRSSQKPPAMASPANRIVIADFASEAADSALSRTVTEALRLDLSRSHLVKVVSDATARGALVLMRKDSATRLTPEVAREVAIREGVRAVLSGE